MNFYVEDTNNSTTIYPKGEYMKPYHLFITLLLAIFLSVATSSAIAQEWSPTQKAVWQNVQDYWKPFAAGDAAGMLSYFHTDYLGWDVNEPLPGTKSDTEKGLNHFLKSNSIVMYTIKPVGINVKGNVAIVHYYYQMTIKNAEGKENGTSGRWTDVLIKQGDKWLLIGDSGGSSAN
jgi:ketosteroid isomerase-like protein